MVLMKGKKKTNRRNEPARTLRVPVRKIALLTVFVGAVTLLSWGVVRGMDPSVMPVRYVEVSGALRHVTPAQVRDRVKRVLEGNFFTANTTAIQREVTALPWVMNASVRRVWPDTLSVAVVEQRAVARWGDDALVNMAGDVFHAEMGQPEKVLPVLQGPKDDALAVVRHYEAALANLGRLNVGIRRLSLDERHAWRVSLSNGVSLILGRQDYAKRLARFSDLYSKVLQQRAERIDSVDMRYSNGLAVRWRNSPSA